MLEYFGVKCLNVCKLLSNGSTNKSSHLIFIRAKKEGGRKTKQMWKVLIGESR